MGKRGPQPKLIEGRAIRDGDYYKRAILFPLDNPETVDEFCDWFDSFEPLERGKLLLLFRQWFQEQQAIALDMAAGN